MNGSLVAFYGKTPKPHALSDLIGQIQDLLAGERRLDFVPYELEQIHATVVGLEGSRVGQWIISSNWVEQRGVVRLLDLKALINIVQSSKHLPVSVQLGGFDVAREYSFSSRGLHPGVRSFSIQGRIAVTMGWPVGDGTFPPSIDLFRRELARAGALHKYHSSDGEVDNDFFFVIGQLERRNRNRTAVTEVQEKARSLLSSRRIDISLRPDDLSLVAYEETTLAPGRTHQFTLDEVAADPQRVIDLYQAAV
jgi:hypothetical protein